MIVAGSASPLLLSSAGGYNLTKSLRFRASASAYLNRTYSSSGNLRLWTLSWWTKRGQLSTAAQTTMFGTDYASNQECQMQFTAGNKFVFEQYTSAGATFLGNLISTQVFRDPSAWYHIVVAWDSAQATASNRIKVYVNGTQITAWDTASYPAQNADSVWNNNTNAHYIGRYSTAKFYDGYQTEINFIDGQALTPSSFGQTSSTTGVWIPKKYTGTYGTNGFYLPFTNTTSTTTLGNDFSGNNNTWTVNNISLTSGVTYDSMNDVPTLTNATTANYATWNPVNNGLGGTVSFANMRLSGVSNVTSRINSTIGVSSGKWYFEATLTTADAFTSIGIGQGNITNQYPGNDALSYAQTLEQATSINNNSQPSYGTAFSSGDVFMCAFDLDTNKLFFGRNGTWFGSSNPATGTNPVYTLTAGTYNAIARPNPSGFASSAVLDINFGQRPFAYTPPTGFVALNTFNLSTPTIGATASSQANKYMDATLYTGTGANLSITNAGGFQPDFVWTKSRSAASTHLLFDSIRGVYNYLISATTDAEATLNTTLTAFNSNGFSIGSNSTINNNGSTNVAWQWRASNAAGVSNTAGSITSTVSANTTAGFSIVTWTGNGVNNATVGHGLGVTPAMIIVKSRTQTYNWDIYHQSLGITATLIFTTAATRNVNAFGTNNPTSSVFSVYTNYTNDSSQNYVAYCFAQVAGYSAFGNYTGNGSSDGPFIFTGFRPRFLLVKRTDGIQNWTIYDSARDTYNVEQNLLAPNTSGAEAVYAIYDFLSNGFKIRNTDNAFNASGGTYIYMAFAESPFKYANAR